MALLSICPVTYCGDLKFGESPVGKGFSNVIQEKCRVVFFADDILRIF
jgi:hypothetical protein